MGLSLQRPQIGETASIGSSLHVAGLATGKGLPEPTAIERVSVQIDSGPPIDATLNLVPVPYPRSPDWVPTWTFHADMNVPAPIGLRTIPAS